MELLGRMPKSLALSGQRSRKFFNRAGNLRRIRGLNYWPLKKVLREKYRFTETEAHAFADFLLPMLHWDPDKRASAQTMLDHPWLTMPANYSTKLSNEEYQAERLKDSASTDLQSDNYANAEMSKLTDSEGEY